MKRNGNKALSLRGVSPRMARSVRGFKTFDSAVSSWVPRPEEIYYEEIIHRLLDIGIKPLPHAAILRAHPNDKVHKALANLAVLTRQMDDAPWEEMVEAALGQNMKGIPPAPLIGWVLRSNHDRTMPMTDFIRYRLAQDEQIKGKWLLPVTDDGEYVSWDLVFVPQNLSLVLNGIRYLTRQVRKVSDA